MEANLHISLREGRIAVPAPGSLLGEPDAGIGPSQGKQPGHSE